MKWFIVLLLTVALSPTAKAADLTCTLPDAYITRGLELCEELRLRLHVRTSDWSNSACASAFLRRGLLMGDRDSTRIAAASSVHDAVNDAVASFNASWPRITAAFCGDGTLDTEFGEECDDGNDVNGDGCDNVCVIEP